MRMPQAAQIRVPTLELEARFAAATLDVDARTVEVTFATGRRVPRVRWRGYDIEEFDEELSLDPSAVRLDRLNAGAPVLDNHRSWGGLDDQLGIVERAWIQSGQGRALIRFRDTPRALEALRSVQDGTLRAISVGYRVHRYEDVTEDARDAKRTLRAIDWEPYEVSLVSMPADIDSGVRSAEDDLRTVPIIARRAHTAGGADMEDETDDNVPASGEGQGQATRTATATPPAAQVDVDAVRREAMELERRRATEIRRACAKAGLGGSALEQRLLDDGTGIDQARAAIIDALADQDEQTETRSAGSIDVGRDDLSKRAEGIVNALTHRATGGREALTDAGRDFRAHSLLELGRNYLEAAGVRTRGMSRSQLASAMLRRSAGPLQGRAHSTSDFGSLLADVGSKQLRRAYAEIPKNYEPFVQETTNPDFKPSRRVQLSAAPPLTKRVEGAETAVGTMTDSAEVTQLATYANIVMLTREAIINDDLTAFSRLIPAQARRVRDLEHQLVYGVLTSNPTMSDGVALFAAGHNNVGGGAIGEVGLTAAFTAIATQKGLNGEEIELMPATIIVPVAQRVKAEQYLSQNIVPTKASDSNPFRGWNLNIVHSPRLDAASTTQWYLAAGKDQIDLIELVYLDDEPGPVFMEDEDFKTDALSYKVRIDLAAHPIDFRGLYRSTGS